MFVGDLVDRGLPSFAQRGDILLDIKFIAAKDHGGRAVFVSVGNLAFERSMLGRLRPAKQSVRIPLLWLVSQDNDGLVLYVNLGIVVVFLVLCRDAVADKNHGEIELAGATNRQGVELLTEFQVDPLWLAGWLSVRTNKTHLVARTESRAGSHFEFLKRSAFEDLGL